MTILWDDGFARGNFMRWHQPYVAGYQDGQNLNGWHQVPDYSHPTPVGLFDYERYNDPEGFNNDLVYLTTDYTRGGPYGAYFKIKNSVSGDWDQDHDNGNQGRRRTELSNQASLSSYYDVLPLYSERWISFSFYVPSDWDDTDYNHWGPSFMQIKPANDYGWGPTFAMGVIGKSWSISTNMTEWVGADSDTPWWHTTYYTNDFSDSSGDYYPNSGNYGQSAFWPQGAVDWVDESTGPGILGNVNKGGWTDFVLHYKFDPRGPSNGGEGFIEVFMRTDAGLPWTHVLSIHPMDDVYKSGLEYNRGSCYNSPANVSGQDYINGGFGLKIGLYCELETAWDHTRDLEIVAANVKIGDENAKFSDMSHDGTYPAGYS